jgi:hypothetical protein
MLNDIHSLYFQPPWKIRPATLAAPARPLIGGCRSQFRRANQGERYRDTPSIQRYIILEQHRNAATLFARAGGDWIGHVFLDGTTSHPTRGMTHRERTGGSPVIPSR